MGIQPSSICGSQVQTQKMLQCMHIALKHEQRSEERILNEHITLLKKLIKDAQPVTETLGNVSVQVAFINTPVIRNEIEVCEKDMKLVFRNEQCRGAISESSFSTHDDVIKQGYIFFSSAYYKGDILRGKAHGNGEMYFCEGNYQIKGKWKYDSLDEGIFYKVVPHYKNPQMMKIFQIKMTRGDKQAIIKTEDFTYVGQVKLQGATKLSHILTGIGKISYTNGDTYNGRLVNGLYETKENENAQLTYREGPLKSFIGFFKGGRRDNRGNLIYRQVVDNRPIDYSINIKFKDGMPVEKGTITCENNEYNLLVSGNKLVIQKEE